MHFYRAQLRLARKHGLPVILHVRRSADQLLQGLREVGGGAGPWQGIAHAFQWQHSAGAAPGGRRPEARLWRRRYL